ncbi:biotin synthase BioB [Rhodoblastus acidophilus]|uniref:Biotin synthase n=1 Tax=Rhodoblastus acidophilus TaxID=1074 RepID=A0A6N8DIZ8_RHOAC|nr:biotin synthase BioB [Rhodoblastus acidophilus]MCW2273434.1 biotin synthase [Rhodoblastus acidophilus]MTV30480.1 biotin synthase BioB [Rhodoblastus acidophilus]
MNAQPIFDAKASVRHDWTLEEIEALFAMPLLDLVHRAQMVHRQYHDQTVQLASLLSIKTGGCAEDCHYCPQSAHFSKATGLVKETQLDVDYVLSRAQMAKEAGATRFCMGAAWRSVRDGAEFDAVLDMVRGVRAMNMEACVTLGMLKPHQAKRLAEAGLTSYNHNLDTSPEFYGEIISTRTYQDRLDTLNLVRAEGIGICCGGIIGMGEKELDRASLIRELSKMNPHPDSVPINALVAVRGTPLEGRPPVDAFDMVRMIAVARITMPKSRVRLSAGRSEMSAEGQALCFMAGANSIFYGEKLLTTENNDAAADRELIEKLGLRPEEIEERSAHYDLDNTEHTTEVNAAN